MDGTLFVLAILSRIEDRRRRRRHSASKTRVNALMAPSLTRLPTRTECCPCDQGRFLGPHKAKKDPGSDAGVLSYASTTENLADKADRLQPVENLIGPEPLEPVQCLVEH